MLWILSLVALALAPLLHRLARSARSALDALDGFVLVTISGIVLLHIVPHTVESQGWIALVVAAVGLLGPGMTERLMGRLAKPAHLLAVLLAVAAVAVHTFMDGAALGGSVAAEGQDRSQTFAIAVILHRLPEGLMIWWLVRPSFGARAAAGLLVMVGAATTIGYFGGGAVLVGAAPRWITLFQALVAGSLLHVVVHRPHPALKASERGQARIWSGIGALAGIGTLAAILGSHGIDAALAAALRALLSLSLKTAPALLAAYVLSGVVYGLMPKQASAWLNKGTRLGQALRGVAVGLPLPICSCGAIPLFRSFVSRGVPAAAAIAFLVAAPEIGIDAALLSIPLLGVPATVARLTAAFFVALLVALIVSKLAPAPAPAPQHELQERTAKPWPARLKNGLKFGLGDMVDETGPWIVLGLCVAAAVDPLLDTALLSRLPRWLDVPVLAIVGVPVYVCASGATPLMAVLMAKGVSPGAAIAFLLTAPATNVTTFGVIGRMFGVRAAAVFAASVALLAIAAGYVVNLVLPAAAFSAPLAQPAERVGPIAYAALAALIVMIVVSLLRQGPRGFLGQLLSLWPHRHEHDAGCTECCDHEHDEHDPCAARALEEHAGDRHTHGHDDDHDHHHGHHHDEGHEHPQDHGHDRRENRRSGQCKERNGCACDHFEGDE